MESLKSLFIKITIKRCRCLVVYAYCPPGRHAISYSLLHTIKCLCASDVFEIVVSRQSLHPCFVKSKFQLSFLLNWIKNLYLLLPWRLFLYLFHSKFLWLHFWKQCAWEIQTFILHLHEHIRFKLSTFCIPKSFTLLSTIQYQKWGQLGGNILRPSMSSCYSLLIEYHWPIALQFFPETTYLVTNFSQQQKFATDGRTKTETLLDLVSGNWLPPRDVKGAIGSQLYPKISESSWCAN